MGNPWHVVELHAELLHLSDIQWAGALVHLNALECRNLPRLGSEGQRYINAAILSNSRIGHEITEHDLYRFIGRDRCELSYHVVHVNWREHCRKSRKAPNGGVHPRAEAGEAGW